MRPSGGDAKASECLRRARDRQRQAMDSSRLSTDRVEPSSAHLRPSPPAVAAERDAGLQIRAGVHTGECEVLGDKLSGVAVHIGARIAALAAGGEVLVSRTVKDLVAGSRIELESRGSASLKGIPGQWEIYAATGA
jgi:class 3 adenylate cyclase